MPHYRSFSIVAIILALVVALGACGSSTPASPTAAATAAPTKAASPTAPPPTMTPLSSTLPTSTVAAAPTGAISPSELAAKARTASEYSFDLKISAPGQNLTGKMYVKGTKLRVEANIAGQSSVLISDTATKVSYMTVAGQNMAMKVDFGQVAAEAPNPSEQVTRIPADAKFVGNETIDGKPAAVYETNTPPSTVTSAQGVTRYAIWIERGLPLRIETTTAAGKTTIEFSNYQFSPQPDSLFQLPPGTNVIDVLSSLTNPLGGLPIPTP